MLQGFRAFFLCNSKKIKKLFFSAKTPFMTFFAFYARNRKKILSLYSIRTHYVHLTNTVRFPGKEKIMFRKALIAFSLEGVRFQTSPAAVRVFADLID